MKIKAWTLLLAALCAAAPALSEGWQGATVAGESVVVRATSGGMLEAMPLRVGQWVQPETPAGQVRLTSLFAPLEGMVAAAEPGAATAEEALLEIAPRSPYRLRAKIQRAQTVEKGLVHGGQTLWVRCAHDGSHRAIARVTEVERDAFSAEVVGGELQIGEVVHLFLEGSFRQEDQIGVATVLPAQPVKVAAVGVVQEMHVQLGETVERGQLLCRLSETDEPVFSCGVSGLVTQVDKRPGERVERGDVLARVATDVRLEIAIDREEKDVFSVGAAFLYTTAAEDAPRPCWVSEVRTLPESGKLAVALTAKERLPIGLSIQIHEQGASQGAQE